MGRAGGDVAANNEPEPQTGESIGAESESRTSSRLSPFNPIRAWYRWLAGVAAVVVVLVVCLLAWGPGMEFPSEVNRVQDDGSVKAVQISRVRFDRD